MTLDQKIALENRQIPFITPLHPLTRAAVNSLKAINTPLVSCIPIKNNEIPEGKFLFICELWDFLGIHPEVRMVNLCWDVNRNEVNEQLSSKLIGVLGSFQDNPEFIPIGGSIINEKYNKLDIIFQTHRREMLKRHIERNDFMVNRKISGLEVWYKTRIQRVDAELPLTNDDRIRRMKEAERANIEKDHQLKRKELEEKKVADITTRRIAVGILEVIHGE